LNLAATIALHAGGPGSGCNPEVGKCGRPATGRAEIESTIAGFAAIYPKVAEKFKSVVGDMGRVESRLKTADSLQEKLARKDYPLSEMSDIIGLRLTVPNIDDVYKAVAKIQDVFDPHEMDDKIKNPPDGAYRAYHMVANVDGKPVEIQVRTSNQSKLADWMHDTVYKGVLKGSAVAWGYARGLSNALYDIDRGKSASLPDCPPTLSSSCFSL
jgi:hypothetical protein